MQNLAPPPRPPYTSPVTSWLASGERSIVFQPMRAGRCLVAGNGCGLCSNVAVACTSRLPAERTTSSSSARNSRTRACPLRQGDVLEWLNDQSDPWRRFAIVVTADCDLAHQKHAGLLACVPVLAHEDYLALFPLPARLGRARAKLVERASTLIRHYQAENRADFPLALSDDAIAAWLDATDVQRDSQRASGDRGETSEGAREYPQGHPDLLDLQASTGGETLSSMRSPSPGSPHRGSRRSTSGGPSSPVSSSTSSEAPRRCGLPPRAVAAVTAMATSHTSAPS